MRINKYIAAHTALSRRAGDTAIAQERVLINGTPADRGSTVAPDSIVTLDGQTIQPETEMQTIMLNKPPGYVCSQRGQGSQTIYDLLPRQLRHLQAVGRLDKDSTGLLLLTNNGELANRLTHPRYQKNKIYIVQLSKQLTHEHERLIKTDGVTLEDGPSRLQLKPLGAHRNKWQVTMSEGRNRQIRRSFLALGYRVTSLHRIQIGDYKLGTLASGHYQPV